MNCPEHPEHEMRLAMLQQQVGGYHDEYVYECPRGCSIKVFRQKPHAPKNTCLCPACRRAALERFRNSCPTCRRGAEGGAAMSCSREAFCKALDDRIEGTNEKRKGFQSVEVVNLAEVKTETIGVAYRLSAKDKGLMLNFCPFCGEKILWLKGKEASHEPEA